MPWLRFKYWESDGLPVRKATVNNHDYIFDDAREGIALIASKRDADGLLKHPSGNYEVAWDQYGIQFDEAGMELLQNVVPSNQDDDEKEEEEAVVPVRRKRGRPRKS